MNTLSKRKSVWGSNMTNRYFWGMPHTETDIAAFKATMHARAEALAAGHFAASTAVEDALERVTRRSSSLLLIDTLFTAMTMLLTYKAGGEQALLFLQLNRWAFALALVAALILMTNLRLVWASDAALHYGDPQAAFDFNMDIYKGRAWRYTTAWVLSFAAFACTLVSITQMK
jgi:hypothetical protein